jgi:elongation factor P
MKVEAGQVRAGNVIELNGKIYHVTHHDIVAPGNWRAMIHLEMKDVITGTKNVERYRTNEILERVRLEQQPCQFLYANENVYTFMNNESFEQFEVSADFLGDKAKFLQDGMNVQVETYEERVLGVELPATVIVEIAETEPVIKGQTATSSYKPAILVNGLRTNVPPFIDAGTKIVVRTEDTTYVERAK